MRNTKSTYVRKLHIFSFFHKRVHINTFYSANLFDLYKGGSKHVRSKSFCTQIFRSGEYARWSKKVAPQSFLLFSQQPFEILIQNFTELFIEMSFI